MSRERLAVTVDRTGSGRADLTASADSIHLEGPLEIAVESRGAPAHVHCRLSGDIARVARVTPLDQSAARQDGNVYVPLGEPTVVVLDLDPVTLKEPLTGALHLSAAYGSVETAVEITLEPEPAGAAVDRTLGTPSRHRENPGAVERALESVQSVTGLDSGTLGVVSLAFVALVVAWSTAAVVGGLGAVLGMTVVLFGVGVGLALLLGVVDLPGSS